MKTASWVIRDKATGDAIMETFDEKKVKALNTVRYEAVPILDYLASLNRKAGPGPAPGTPGGLPACPHGRGLACRTCYAEYYKRH